MNSEGGYKKKKGKVKLYLFKIKSEILFNLFARKKKHLLKSFFAG